MDEIGPGIFVETGYEGVNVGAIVMKQGIICIDAPSYPRDARHWTTTISHLHRWHVRYLLLTNGHGDRVLNTRWLSAPIVSHQIVADRLFGYDKRYPQRLLESLSQRNLEGGRDLANGPVDMPAVSFSKTLTLVDDENTVELHYRPGPTAGNAWVYLPNEKILFTGDGVVSGTFPPLAEMCCHSWLTGLQGLLAGDLAVEMVVPGRGQPGGPEIARPLVEFLEQMQLTVTDHIVHERPKEELKHQVAQFEDVFPLGKLPLDWVQKQVRLGLEGTYDELQNDIPVNDGIIG